MNILIDIGHPSHVHLFKNVIKNLSSKGHRIKITAREKDVTRELLLAYSFEHTITGKKYRNAKEKLLGLPKVEFELYKIAKQFNPDLLLGASGNFYVAHVGKLLNVPSIVFEDSEPDPAFRWLCQPFATNICTPELFELDCGPKHLRYKGYKELAYLHPNHFVPDPTVLDTMNINPDEKFILFRFVGWKAAHDISQSGLDVEQKIKFVKAMGKYCKVFISSESQLPDELNELRLAIPPHKVHDVLGHAFMFITDGQTMSTEASVLGVPTIRTNSFVGTMSNFKELEHKYGLMYSIREPEEALNKAIELQNSKNLKQIWGEKRKKLLEDKIDVASFIVDLVEGFPGSINKHLLHSQGT